MLSKRLKTASKDAHVKRGGLWCPHAAFACCHIDLLVTPASEEILANTPS